MSRVFRWRNKRSGVSPRSAAVPSDGSVGPYGQDLGWRNGQGPPPPSRPAAARCLLGPPGRGPGLAAWNPGIVAFVVDAIGRRLRRRPVHRPELPGNWSLLSFGLVYVVNLVAFGQTPGMRLVGLRLAHPRQGQRLALARRRPDGPAHAAGTALVVDFDGRGLHDRLTDTAVVRRRGDRPPGAAGRSHRPSGLHWTGPSAGHGGGEVVEARLVDEPGRTPASCRTFAVAPRRSTTRTSWGT